MLKGTGLAPRFFAHVHEDGRVIGFILERIEGVLPLYRIWTSAKLLWENSANWELYIEVLIDTISRHGIKGWN